jgi:hypothetical protein
MSFPLVGNPSPKRLRTSLPASGGAEGDQGRSDKKQCHTYVLLSKSFLRVVENAAAVPRLFLLTTCNVFQSAKG